MQRLLARWTTPLTWLLWILVVVGMADYFLGPFLPPEVVEFGIILLWLVAALTWFGWRRRKRDEAGEGHRNAGDPHRH
jgi:hypothetical protein